MWLTYHVVHAVTNFPSIYSTPKPVRFSPRIRSLQIAKLKAEKEKRRRQNSLRMSPSPTKIYDASPVKRSSKERMRLQMLESRQSASKRSVKERPLVPLEIEGDMEEITPLRRRNRNRRHRRVVLPDLFQDDEPMIEDNSSVGPRVWSWILKLKVCLTPLWIFSAGLMFFLTPNLPIFFLPYLAFNFTVFSACFSLCPFPFFFFFF